MRAEAKAILSNDCAWDKELLIKRVIVVTLADSRLRWDEDEGDLEWIFCRGESLVYIHNPV